MENNEKEELNENKQEEIKQEETKKEEVDNSSEINLDELGKVKEELDDLTDRYKRMMAEFENYKKRNSKEREFLYANVMSDVMTSILPVMDNLEKAAEAKVEDTAYQDGVKLILRQLTEVLEKNGVTQIESIGKTFDPEFHEAVTHVQDDKKGEQEIVEEYRKGYKIGTKVIRHAMVVVAN